MCGLPHNYEHNLWHSYLHSLPTFNLPPPHSEFGFQNLFPNNWLIPCSGKLNSFQPPLFFPSPLENFTSICHFPNLDFHIKQQIEVEKAAIASASTKHIEEFKFNRTTEDAFDVQRKIFNRLNSAPLGTSATNDRILYEKRSPVEPTFINQLTPFKSNFSSIATMPFLSNAYFRSHLKGEKMASTFENLEKISWKNVYRNESTHRSCEEFPGSIRNISSNTPGFLHSIPAGRLNKASIKNMLEHSLYSKVDQNNSANGQNKFHVKVDSESETTSHLTSNLKARSHKCFYCGKLYSRKYGLKIHIRTHTGYKPLKCKVCSRPFGDPSNLNKHVRLHAVGDTPYKCEFCGKVLVRRRDLERHIRSRHPDEANSSHCKDKLACPPADPRLWGH